MHLTDKHIDEFIELYRKHYGVILDREDAEEKAVQLCRFVQLTSFRPRDEHIHSKFRK